MFRKVATLPGRDLLEYRAKSTQLPSKNCIILCLKNHPIKIIVFVKINILLKDCSDVFLIFLPWSLFSLQTDSLNFLCKRNFQNAACSNAKPLQSTENQKFLKDNIRNLCIPNKVKYIQ